MQKTRLNETNNKDENDETDTKRRAGGAFQRGPGELFGTLWGGLGSLWALFLELFRWQKSVQKRKR